MAVIKNDYPILEYDTESAEILRPEFGMQGLRLPKKCVYAFLGDVIDVYAASLGSRTVWSIHTITKDYPVYVTDCQEEEIVLCEAPLGASAAVQNLDSLIACGVERSYARDPAASLPIFLKTCSWFRSGPFVMRELLFIIFRLPGMLSLIRRSSRR